MDWGLGEYERIAKGLLPAAVVGVDQLCPLPNEHVVDLGAGTGNAALIAASLGSKVTAIDPSPRLLQVGKERGEKCGLSIETLLGTADSIPLSETSIDAVISVFGVIFSPNPRDAATEISRVMKATSRLVLCAWVPGPLGDLGKVRREAVSNALLESPAPPPFAWHDKGALQDLFSPFGFGVSLQEKTISFRSPNLDQYIQDDFTQHPGWVEARLILEPIGRWKETADQAISILKAANEDPREFCVTSHYVVAFLARKGAT